MARTREPTPLDELPDVLDIGDLAAALGIGRTQASELMHSTRFPSFQATPDRLKVSKRALMLWMEMPALGTDGRAHITDTIVSAVTDHIMPQLRDLMLDTMEAGAGRSAGQVQALKNKVRIMKTLQGGAPSTQ